jgi:hypothetical protein
MKACMPRNFPASPPRKQQRGFAALLAVLLAGLGLTAATFGSLYSVRGVQDANLAVHKTTQTQAKAWQTVEMVRMALVSMSATEVAALPVSTEENPLQGALTITGLTDITAKVTANTNPAGGRRITVQITATGASGTASTTIEVIYQIIPSANNSNTQINLATVNINRDLNLTGSITMLGGSDANVSVTGTVDLRGSITSINTLCATDDISIGSGISVNTVCTNGNLIVSAGATVGTAIVKGNVTVTGGAAITTIRANGNVTLSGGSAHADYIETKGDVSITGGNAYARAIKTEGNVVWSSSSNTPSTINANGTVTFSANSPTTVINAIGNVTLSGNGNVNNVSSNGNVSINSNWGNGIQGTLRATGSLTWSSNGAIVGTSTNIGTVGGTVKSPIVSGVHVNQTTGYRANVVAVSISVINNAFQSSLVVDAYTLEASSNYAFKIDPSGKKTVTIRDVSNIADGTYYLGYYNATWWPVVVAGGDGYLCSTVDSSGRCTAPAVPGKTLCGTDDSSVNCFNYTPGTQTWEVKRTTMAPGVAWFDGSLEVKNGIYFNTFIATKNIRTAGQSTTYAVNYAGYAGVCLNASVNGRTSSAQLTGLYPKAYCEASRDVLAGVLKPQSLGNAAFIAGGYKDGVFQGGLVLLTAGNEVFGSVIAGNDLETSGNTTVHGQVYVAAQGTDTTVSWKGSTTIDLRNLPDTFNPSIVPCIGSCSTPGGSNAATARVFWSRYL